LRAMHVKLAKALYTKFVSIVVLTTNEQGRRVIINHKCHLSGKVVADTTEV